MEEKKDEGNEGKEGGGEGENGYIYAKYHSKIFTPDKVNR